jgi:hypothetical protein
MSEIGDRILADASQNVGCTISRKWFRVEERGLEPRSDFDVTAGSLRLPPTTDKAAREGRCIPAVLLSLSVIA